MDTIRQIKEIFGEDPRIEDVFRVAEDKGISLFSSCGTFMSDGLFLYKGNDPILKLHSYNPTLPLLEQSEDTLTQLLTLFK